MIEEAFELPPSYFKAPVAVKFQLCGDHLFFVHLMDCCKIHCFVQAGWGSHPAFLIFN